MTHKYSQYPKKRLTKDQLYRTIHKHNNYKFSCIRKHVYNSYEEASYKAQKSDLNLEPYKCGNCKLYHLRSKSKRNKKKWK